MNDNCSKLHVPGLLHHRRLRVSETLTLLSLPQYFLKVVSTKFVTLSREELSTHQYSVTEYERDLNKGNQPGKDDLGHQTSHGYAGVPGLFFSYEISPMLVIHKETRQSFAHFLTDTCAIVGGVLTVAGLIVRSFLILA